MNRDFSKQGTLRSNSNTDWAPKMSAATARVALPQLSDPDCERERLLLLELGESIHHSFPDARRIFRPWLTAVRGLSDTACDTFSAEAALSSLAWELRRRWLRYVNENTDGQIKSPPRGSPGLMPSGAQVAYGYERSIQPTRLESRCHALVQVPPGWSADHVLFSSAQSALTSILHWANCAGYWDAASPHLTFAGSYFETQHVLNVFQAAGLVWAREKSVSSAAHERARASRTILIEPVFYDEGVNVLDIAALHRAWSQLFPNAPALVILDTTLAGPTFAVDELLKPFSGESAPIVIAFRSGLKLDQAGLELANVGISSIYCHWATRLSLKMGVADALRHFRTVLGSSLTFGEISALDAPWFLSRRHLQRHVQAVFDHNDRLASEVSARNRLFAQVLHPRFASASCEWTVAPYCILRLPNPVPEHYRLLEAVLDREAATRNLLFDLGGSFGFRGNRFEAVIPDAGLGEPFLRVAMGARSGPSVRGVIELLCDVASTIDIDDLIARHHSAEPHSVQSARLRTDIRPLVSSTAYSASSGVKHP